MSKFASLLLTSLLVLSGTILRANSLVQFPDGPAAWTISTAPSQIATTPPAALNGFVVQSVDVVQNDTYRSNKVSYYSGISRITWEIVGTNLLLTTDPHGTAFLTPVSQYFFVPFLPNVFDWLSPQLLVEKQPTSHGGKLCYHYKLTEKDPLTKKEKTEEAWIDSKTKLPVALDDGFSLATFTFHPAPDAPLLLPPEFKTIVDHYKVVMGIHKTPQGSN